MSLYQSSETMVGGRAINPALGGVWSQVSNEKGGGQLTVENEIRLRDVLVGELLSKNWSVEYIKSLRRERGRYMEGRGAGTREGAKRVAGWWNGIMGEAIGRRLWKRVTQGETENVPQMDMQYKTDALGRLRVNGEEVAVLMQFKATSELEPGEMFFYYPDTKQRVALRYSQDGIQEDEEGFEGRGGTILKKLDSVVGQEMLRVAGGLNYRKLGIEVNVPMIVVFGVGHNQWSEVLEMVEQGKVDGVFRRGLVKRFDKSRSRP